MISVKKIGEHIWLLSSGNVQRRIYGEFAHTDEVILFAFRYGYLLLAEGS